MKPRNPDRERARLAQTTMVQPSPAVLALLVGTSLHERCAANRLKESDFLSVARDILFGAFAEFTRYERITSGDLEHAPTCARGYNYVRYESHVLDNPPRGSAMAWSRYVTANELAKRRYLNDEHPLSATAVADPTAVLRAHTATCRCGATARRLSVHVTIYYAGYTLVREYAFLTSL